MTGARGRLLQFGEVRPKSGVRDRADIAALKYSSWQDRVGQLATASNVVREVVPQHDRPATYLFCEQAVELQHRRDGLQGRLELRIVFEIELANALEYLQAELSSFSAKTTSKPTILTL
jgi:hypothetical protein